MKKIISLLLLLSFVSVPAKCMAEALTLEDVQAPVWEEYVPSKYQNPRSFPNRGKNIAELSVGILLTDLLITAPIGIPMITHSTTKLKNQGWYEKKEIYKAGLIEAEEITDPQAKKAYYENLKKRCKLTEDKRQKQLKRLKKQRMKAEKEAAKNK